MSDPTEEAKKHSIVLGASTGKTTHSFRLLEEMRTSERRLNQKALEDLFLHEPYRRILYRDLVSLTPSGALPAEVVELKRQDTGVIVELFDRILFDRIARDPAEVRCLSGHEFENFIAEVLRRLRMEDIQLRVPTAGGEADILCFERSILGYRIGHVFELKQLAASGRPVSLREVKSLFSLREALRFGSQLERAIFLTTTDYTRPSKRFAAAYGLELAGLEQLSQWLSTTHAV